MFTYRSSLYVRGIILGIWKWRPRSTSCISTRPVGNDFQQPRGNQASRHLHMSTISTPTGNLPALDIAGRPRP
jgi:hypothetical protein